MKSIIKLSVLLVFVVASAFTFTTTSSIAADGYDIGDTAIDFSLKNVDGKMVSLSDYADAKGFIVIFTCNHCPFAVKYEDRIIDLHNKYAKAGYPVIAINPNNPDVYDADSYANMIVRAKDKGFDFPYVIDEGQKIYPAYGATKTPHVYLLDADRVVKYIGAIDDNVDDASKVKVKYLENAIAKLNSGSNPDPATTKAVGCGIK